MFKRLESILMLATSILIVPLIVGQLAYLMTSPSANSAPDPSELHPQDIQVNWKQQAIEGQSYGITIRVSHEHQPTDSPLFLTYKDGTYEHLQLKKITKRLDWQGKTHSLRLYFHLPGRHKLTLKTANHHLLKSTWVSVAPFPATVFPKQWDSHKTLSKNPSDWHLFVNLYAESKHPKGQRQYAQITHKGQIIERLLVSSGAEGYATPTGQFKLGFKEYYPRSARYGNTPMPFWSAIDTGKDLGDLGFHSLEGEGYMYLLGQPASHGCIRLSRFPSVETEPKTGQKYWGDRGGARWIFDRVPPGASVTIFSAKRPLFASETFEQALKYLYPQVKQKNGTGT